MDPLLMALSLMRRRKFEECVKLCTELLEKNPLDKAAWVLKLRALTAQTYIDEVEVDEEGIAEMTMDDNTMTDQPRPGTSFKAPVTRQDKRVEVPASVMRPLSQSGRPVTGFVRPGTQSARPDTIEQAIRTARTASTARPVTTSSGRHIRLGTASMLSERDGPFVDPSKMNLAKYAKQPGMSKALFEYLFHHENDVRSASTLAREAASGKGKQNWWWKLQLGKCYYRLGLLREAEAAFRESLTNQDTLDIYLYLGKLYIRLDHPLSAIDWYQKGLKKYPGEVTLLIGIARVHEGLKDNLAMCSVYRDVLHFDNTNVEATACLAANFFYNDQPEVALLYYRRLLLMGVATPQVYNNMAMSCFYAHHFDSTFMCFERALQLSNDEEMSDIWYNIGCVFTAMAEKDFAMYAHSLATASNSTNAEAFNNLAVLKLMESNHGSARELFNSSTDINPMLYEAQFNKAHLQKTLGEYSASFNNVKKALAAFPDHYASKTLLESLRRYFSSGDPGLP